MPSTSSRVFSLILIFSTLACAQVTLNTVPSREVGHPILPKPDPFAVSTGNPNLVEGREFFNPFAIALDTAASPPILYVADTSNNRILAWRNAATFANGQVANLVIGQKDFYSTGPNGPGISSASTGFNSPGGLAVFNGDLYVSDTGNNRVMRFRAPFSVPAGQQQIPDFCLGQASFGLRGANAPNGVINDRGIAGPGYIRFDRTGNLWLADTGNNRVLQFAAADVAKSNVFAKDLQAKIEIGQLDFVSKAPALQNTDAGRKTTNQLASPAAINFDSAGRLYIADGDSNNGLSRVLVFLPPFTPGMSATRIMGVPPPAVAGGPPPTNQQTYSVAMLLPSDIFFLPGTQGIGILDAGYHRILLFDTFDNWPDPATAFSPSAKAIIGHASGLTGVNPLDQKSLVRNDGNAQGSLSSASTFNFPQTAIFFNNELFVADTFNHRVLVMPYANGTIGPAYRLLGQDRYDSNSVNLIEGREFSFSASLNGQTTADSAIAIDSSTDTPHLYVSDPYNNRVLGFKDIRKLKAGSPADIVIGQPDFATAICDFPTGDTTQPLQNNLCRPTGLLVDGAGNLYVADSGNSRVLRFPAPFSHAGNQVADLVLGQSSFFFRLTDPSASAMGTPYGLAFAGNQGLLVSDQSFNRVLFIPFTNGGFTSADNGKAATKVLGQPDFTSTSAGGSDTGLNVPRHVSADTDGRPYVVDAVNNRVQIFDSINRVPPTGAHATLTLSGQFNTVSSIFVNSATGETWLADINGNRVLKYPKYDTLQFNPAPTSTVLSSFGPIALAQDQYGDLIVAERTNRVTFYFPGVSSVVNAANLVINRGLAPNTWATAYPASGASFGKDTAVYSDLPNPLPIPKVLADVQVLLDGTPCPVSFTSPGQINFLTPWDAATGGSSDLQVIKVSTGQVLAAGLVPMNLVSPGIFTSGSKIGNNIQAAVINQDGTVNGPNNRAARGDIISIYATGQGFIAGHPADGELAGSPLNSDHVRVAIGTCFTDTCPLQPNEKPVAPDFIQFSGTQFPGLWQVNVQIPQATDPTLPVPVALNINSITSNGLAVNNAIAVIYVKDSK